MLIPHRVKTMTKLIGTLVMSAAVGLAPVLAAAQDETEWQIETPQPEALPPSPWAEQAPGPEAWAEQAPGPEAWAEQAPEAEAQAASPVPPGQWVYTQQYGWIWMPYADAYTRAPANGYGEPYAYVYSPAYSCWTWLAAPWVWGIGPWPVFGVYGPARFAWYGHGWWRHPARWHYAPSRGYAAGYGFRPAYRGGWNAARTAPYRGGSGSFRGSVREAPRGGGTPFIGHGGGGFPRPQGGGAPFIGHGGGGSPRPQGGGAAFIGHGGGGFPRPQGGGAAFVGHGGGGLPRPHGGGAAFTGRGGGSGSGGHGSSHGGRSAGGRGGHGRGRG